MNTPFNLIAYIVYLPVAIVMTIAVANQLFKNGRIFMLDIFHQKEDIAYATNALFKMGFYLLNIGFALLIIRIYTIMSAEELIVRLSTKIGGFAIYLGIIMMLNLLLFMRGRKQARRAQRNIAIQNNRSIDFE
ncbi:hypothetical protein DBR32_00815 [Taibaiella sp. KBW10]|uniref:hypothetical protein n=1 Tax=Taibaiella sp. KBW10 TaxID=2153357 RepID=UPI000F58F322|nr:hypothetical protein [Taibaiella sp. KBW10]RQO32188.1 hypothetical protein DBR32_00815 [Taibaiella sp. KBW10]